MQYTGDGCDATNHSQDPKKVSVSGDPNDETPVYIVAMDKDDPDYSKAKIWFEGIVDLDGEFDISALNAGESKLKSKTYVYIYDVTGSLLLQSVMIRDEANMTERVDLSVDQEVYHV